MAAQGSSVTTAVLNALSNDGRRRILRVIAEHGGRMTSGEIAEQFFSTVWSTTTRHLAVLRDAGLVSVRTAWTRRPTADIQRSVSVRCDLLARNSAMGRSTR